MPVIPRLQVECQAKLVDAVRFHVMKGIAAAGQDGRKLGATNVRVVVDGDREIVGDLSGIELLDEEQ